GARDWLNDMLTNNVAKLDLGQGQYTFLLNDNGGVIDDLILYRIGEAEFSLVVNASKIEEDFAWLERHLKEGPSPCQLKNRSADFGGVAIQGPRVVDLFHDLLGQNVELPARNHIRDFAIAEMPVSIARTGYTGEDGMEVFFRAKDAAKFWNLVLERGAKFGTKPCGLGARDTLRLEMCYPLNGSDLSPDRNPIEAGLGFFVDLEKPNFTGGKNFRRQLRKSRFTKKNHERSRRTPLHKKSRMDSTRRRQHPGRNHRPRPSRVDRCCFCRTAQGWRERGSKGAGGGGGIGQGG